MRRLAVFESVSLDGFFTDADNDMTFAKSDVDDPEFDAFVAQNASGEGVLLFGRVTYQMMSSFWPSPMAAEMAPVVAKRMNERPKIVFSNTLGDAPWTNTTLMRGDAVENVRKLKNEPGRDMVVLGSGSLVSQLSQAGLIDEYQFAIVPVVLGQGRSLFPDVARRFALTLNKTRSFANGTVFVSYERSS